MIYSACSLPTSTGCFRARDKARNTDSFRTLDAAADVEKIASRLEGGSSLFKNHALAVALGLVLSVPMVWWVQPDSDAAVGFLVLVTTLVCWVAASILFSILGSRKLRGASDGEKQ
jgi:protein-S-isoprenylcysteine O-methyltransferase Ste14